jgi:hypothetical protein
VGPVWPLEADADRTSVRSIQFVEVQPGPTIDPAPMAADAVPITPPVGESRWSLWGELEA